MARIDITSRPVAQVPITPRLTMRPAATVSGRHWVTLLA